MPFPIVQPQNARNVEYKAHLEAILESGVCPFCSGGDTLKKQDILRESAHWYALRNAHPLENTKQHFLFIPKRHIEQRIELNAEELADLLAVEESLKKEYEITGSALFGRDGNPLITGATVAHLHFQMIVPDGVTQVYFGPRT